MTKHYIIIHRTEINDEMLNLINLTLDEIVYLPEEVSEGVEVDSDWFYVEYDFLRFKNTCFEQYITFNETSFQQKKFQIFQGKHIINRSDGLSGKHYYDDLSHMIKSDDAKLLTKIYQELDESSNVSVEVKTFPDAAVGDIALVKASNTSGSIRSYTQSITTWTTSMQEALNPSITNVNLSATSIELGLELDATISTLTATGGVFPITYALTSDPSGFFKIEGNYLKIADANYESGSYEIQITATDAASTTYVKTVSIVVASAAPKALSFNGVDEYGEISNDASMNTTSFTWTFVLYPDNTGASQYLGGKFTTTGNRCYYFLLGSNRDIAFTASGDGVTVDSTGVTNLANGIDWAQRNYIAITYNGTTGECIIYKNGTQVGQKTMSVTGIFYTAIPVAIGTLNSGFASQRYTGDIERITFHNAVLSQAQIQAIDSSGAAGSASLVSYWEMGEFFSAGVSPDQQGSNDLSTTNMDASNIVEIA